MIKFEITYFRHGAEKCSCFLVLAKDEDDAEQIFRIKYPTLWISGIYKWREPDFYTRKEIETERAKKGLMI